MHCAHCTRTTNKTISFSPLFDVYRITKFVRETSHFHLLRSLCVPLRLIPPIIFDKSMYKIPAMLHNTEHLHGLLGALHDMHHGDHHWTQMEIIENVRSFVHSLPDRIYVVKFRFVQLLQFTSGSTAKTNGWMNELKQATKYCSRSTPKREEHRENYDRAVLLSIVLSSHGMQCTTKSIENSTRLESTRQSTLIIIILNFA